MYPRDLIGRAVNQDLDPFSRASAIDRLLLTSTSSSSRLYSSCSIRSFCAFDVILNLLSVIGCKIFVLVVDDIGKISSNAD